MRFLVISDTHGSITEAAMLIEAWHERIDGVLHLGDHARDLAFLDKQYRQKYGLSFASVAGNCDFSLQEKKERIFTISDAKILMCHGDRYHVGDGLAYYSMKAREEHVRVALFGHTHIPCQIEQEGILYLNPGSLSRPRGGSEKSFAILEIEKGESAPKVAATILEYDAFL